MYRILTLCFLSIFIYSCSKEKTNISELVIISDNEVLEPIEVIRPIDGMILWNNKRDTIRINNLGNYSYSFDIDSPEIVRLHIGNERLKMIVQPSHSYQIKANDSMVIFTGDNAKGNNLLNTLHGAYNNSLDDMHKYESDSTSVSIKKKINIDKEKEISQLDALFSQNLIDEEFYNLFKNEIDYRYAEKIVNIVLSKSYNGDIINPDLETFLNETIDAYPVSARRLPSNWTQYAEFAVIERNQYKQKKEGLITSDSLINLSINGGIKQYKESLITNNLKGEFREKLLAYYLIFSTKQKNYEKYLVNFFENFKASYPKSKYTEYLQPEINEIKDYHIKVSKDLPKTVKIIQDDSISNLNNLLKKFEGQKVYIDLWATWCGPCKQEFKYNEGIDEILKENNYKKLFISIDEIDKKEKWIEMIKFYDLNGYHFLANKSFKSHFANNYSMYEGGYSIPQYLLIDELGNVITKNAPRPSQPDELSKLLTAN